MAEAETESTFEIEGTLVRGLRARELDKKGMMRLEVVMSPWRRLGVDRIGTGVLTVHLEVDLDYADAWMRADDTGQRLRVTCTSLTEPSEPGGEAHAIGTELSMPP